MNDISDTSRLGRGVGLELGDATGPLVLVATAGRAEVRGGPDAATVIATVERAAGAPQPSSWSGAHALVAQDRPRPPLDDRRGRRHPAGFVAHRRPPRTSIPITAHQQLPWPTAVLLGLIGGYLALLQAEVDASAAVAGIVAAGPV